MLIGIPPLLTFCLVRGRRDGDAQSRSRFSSRDLRWLVAEMRVGALHGGVRGDIDAWWRGLMVA